MSKFSDFLKTALALDVARFAEIATRRDAGMITPVTYSDVLDRCTFSS